MELYILILCVMLNFNYIGADDNSIKDHPNLGLLPKTCGIINEYESIGMKSAALLYEFPWMALIWCNKDDDFEFACSGTVINDRYILTSASCAKKCSDARVRIGELDLQQKRCGEENSQCSPVQEIQVEEQIHHESYQESHKAENNIGLLRLKKHIDLSLKNAAAVCLPTTEELLTRPLAGQYARLVSWELKNPNNKRLFRSYTAILNQTECEANFNHVSTLNKVCDMNPAAFGCLVESGSPLVTKNEVIEDLRYFQFGIFSEGPKNCERMSPSLFTDVSKYMGWILDNIKS